MSPQSAPVELWECISRAIPCRAHCNNPDEESEVLIIVLIIFLLLQWCSRYHILAGETRGEVLDNSFNNGSCVLLKSENKRTKYRLPANLYNISFEVIKKDQVLYYIYSSTFLLGFYLHLVSHLRTGRCLKNLPEDQGGGWSNYGRNDVPKNKEVSPFGSCQMTFFGRLDL